MNDSTFETAVKSLCDIIKIDSVASDDTAPGAPFGKGPRKALDYALDLLKDLGFRTKDGDGYYGYGEVGDENLPLFGILAHLDVVPVSQNWTYPPFGAEIHDGAVYGRGTLDDKGPAIAAIYALHELLSEGLTPKKRVRIILGCDEETGWRCMEHYQKEEELPEEGFSPDADFPVINCEKGLVCHEVIVKVPNTMWFSSGTRSNIVPELAQFFCPASHKLALAAEVLKVEANYQEDDIVVAAHGISAHGSTPEQGVNAALLAFRVLGAEYPVFKQLYDAFQIDGSGLGLKIHDDASGDLTLNLGIVKTERNKETNENTLHCTIDIRHPITTTRDEITARIKEKLPFAEVKRLNYHDPLYVPKDDPLVKTLLDVYNEKTGDHAEPITIGGGTYAKMLPKGVAYGPVFPGEPSLIHGDDENITLETFRKTIDIYKEAIRRLCF